MAQINVEGDPKLTQIQLVYMGDNTVLDTKVNPANAALACTYAITTGIFTTVSDHGLVDADVVFLDNITGGTVFKRRLPYFVKKGDAKTFTLSLTPRLTYIVKDAASGGTANLWKPTTIGDAEELFCGGFSTSPYRISYLPDGNYTGYLDRKPSRPTERNYDFGFMSEIASFGKTLAECTGTKLVVAGDLGTVSLVSATSIVNTLYWGQKIYVQDVGTSGLTADTIYFICDILADGKSIMLSTTAPDITGKVFVNVAIKAEADLDLFPIVYDITTVNQHDALLSASVSSVAASTNLAANVGKPIQPMVYYPQRRPKPALKNLNWYLDDIKHKIEGFASDISLNFTKGEIATISYNCLGKFKDLPSKGTCPTIVDHYKNEYPKYMLRELEVYQGAFGVPMKVLGVDLKLQYPYWAWSGALWELKDIPDPEDWTDYFSFVCSQVSFGLGNANVLRGDMRETFGNTAPTVVDRGIGYSLTIEEQDAEGNVNIWDLIQSKEPVTPSDIDTAWIGAPNTAAPKIKLQISLGDSEGEKLTLQGSLSINSMFDRGGGGVATIGISGGALLDYCETQDDVLVPGMPTLTFG